MDYARTEPIREFARRRGLSPQTVYDWNNRGLIETFLIGDRRHVVISSYERLVERLVTEQAGAKLSSPNPRARASVAAPTRVTEHAQSPYRRKTTGSPPSVRERKARRTTVRAR
jgi:hypothetical protein